jgi:hypothetical protein
MEGGLVRTPSMHAARDEFSRFVVAQHDFYYSTATCDFRFKHNAGRRAVSAAPGLRDHQFPAVLLFQFHGFAQREDGAFNLIVTGRLRRDALEPQPGLGHEREN